jgi:DNA-binding response OmpR family regulator
MAASVLRVLVVEDDEQARAAYQVALAGVGHEVVVVGTRAAALEVAREFKPDVVVLDLVLPDGDGHDVARELRLGIAPPAIIAVTGLHPDAIHVKTDIDVVMRKPVELHMFASLIEYARAKHLHDLVRSSGASSEKPSS